MHVRANYKMEELCFILEGAFGLYHPNGRIFKQKGLEPAVILKQSSVFGDYQLLFDLNTCMEMCPYVPGRYTSQKICEILEFDCEMQDYRLMCLRNTDFKELCELYPDTAE